MSNRLGLDYTSLTDPASLYYRTLRGDVRKLTSEAASLRVRVRELERALGDAGVALPLTSDNTFGRTDECWWVANAVGSLEIADDEEPNIAVSLRSSGLWCY